jgi:hypothetical protein
MGIFAIAAHYGGAFEFSAVADRIHRVKSRLGSDRWAVSIETSGFGV